MLLSIETGKNHKLIKKILDILFPDAMTILDMTYGSGRFWNPQPGYVVGMDINPQRAPNVIADFNHLPFLPQAFDVCIFDPPYQTDVSRHTPSVMGSKFGHFKNLKELEANVIGGCREAWRTSRLGIIVKVQDYIHGAKRIRMTKWVEDAIGQAPYDIVFLMKQSMISDPYWNDQLSVRSNHTTFLIFRHGDQTHKRRSSL